MRSSAERQPLVRVGVMRAQQGAGWINEVRDRDMAGS
jgi:hypothetical protein